MAAFPLVPAQLVLAFNPVQVCVTAGRALILSPKKKHLLSGKWNVEVILRRRRVKNLLQHFHSLVVASGCVPIWRHFYSYNSVRLGLGWPLAMSAARYSELQIAFVYANWMLRGREALRPELKRLINTLHGRQSAWRRFIDTIRCELGYESYQDRRWVVVGQRLIILILKQCHRMPAKITHSHTHTHMTQMGYMGAQYGICTRSTPGHMSNEHCLPHINAEPKDDSSRANERQNVS